MEQHLVIRPRPLHVQRDAVSHVQVRNQHAVRWIRSLFACEQSLERGVALRQTAFTHRGHRAFDHPGHGFGGDPVLRLPGPALHDQRPGEKQDEPERNSGKYGATERHAEGLRFGLVAVKPVGLRWFREW